MSIEDDIGELQRWYAMPDPHDGNKSRVRRVVTELRRLQEATRADRVMMRRILGKVSKWMVESPVRTFREGGYDDIAYWIEALEEEPPAEGAVMIDIDAIGPGPFCDHEGEQDGRRVFWTLDGDGNAVATFGHQRAAQALANILNREWDRVHPPADRRCGTCEWFLTTPLSDVIGKCTVFPYRDATKTTDHGTDCPVWKRKEKA